MTRSRLLHVANGTATTRLRLMHELAHAATPLVASSMPLTADGVLAKGTLSITEAGRAVLEGRAYRIDLCGIDRWIGGVHLQRGDRLWRRDREAGRLVLTS